MKKYYFVILLMMIHFGIKAHPHVFIETNITIIFSQNAIDSLFIRFDFDPMFSADLIQNFDKNHSNQFEKNEVDSIFKNAFSNLINYNYFIHVIDGNKMLMFTSVSDFNVNINSEGIAQYSFNIDTDIKTNIANKKVKISAYDHSYFIDVRFEKEYVKFKNKELSNFSWKLIEDKSMAYYYDQIYPNCAVITLN